MAEDVGQTGAMDGILSPASDGERFDAERKVIGLGGLLVSAAVLIYIFATPLF